MKITTTLSVSSVILASVLSGCSQQAVGGSQVAGGSQQSAGGSQVSGGSQQQVEGGSQVASGSSQQMSSQQQVEEATPVVAAPVAVQPKPRVYKPRKMQQKVYTRGPAPRATRSVAKRSTGLPPAKPGQCFAKVKTAATYTTKTKKVLIQKASSKRVLVRAPQYQWVNKKVLVRKATYRNNHQPAQYRTVNQRVLVKPAYNTWKKGHGAITRIDNMTGEIMCLVKVPAVYKNVQKRVLVRAAKNTRTLIPAVYKNVRSMKKSAPALYKTVKRPARYKTQTYRVKTGGSRYVWKPVLCQTNAPKAAVKQKAVKRSTKKYNSGGISKQDYLRVMNAGKSKQKMSRKATKQSIISQADYNRVMNATKPKKKTSTKAAKQSIISQEDYLRVMNAGKKPTKVKTKAKAKTQAKNALGISQADYLRVMNAGNAKASKAKTSTKRAVLKAKTAAPTPAKAAPTAKAAPETNATDSATNKTSIVLGIQKALKEKGFDPGAADGKMGASTAAALKAFQSSRGLPVGVLTKDTFRALGLIR